MTLEDAHECMRQADAIGWRNMPGPGNGAEKPRVLIIGGEPTLHPDFLEFVRIAGEWTGTYVQVLSNGYTPESRALLLQAQIKFSASIFEGGFKTGQRKEIHDGEQSWNMETCVSPAEAGMPCRICYVHASEICGIGVDHHGYSLCPIGLSVAGVLGVPARTRNLADLWDREKAYGLTLSMCRHCGYAGLYRYEPIIEQFRNYTDSCQLIHGVAVSPIWERALLKLLGGAS
jgi:hypothetical protein